MNYKRLSTLVLWTTALLVSVPGIAAATTATSPSGTTYTSTISGSSEGHMIFHDTSGLGLTSECNSAFSMNLESHGAGVTASGKISSLTFSNCTNSTHVTVLKGGFVTYHSIAGTKNSTETSTGKEVTELNTSTGIHCIWTTNNTHWGTLIPNEVTGSNATLQINATMQRTGGTSGFFCGSSRTWTGSYKITTPASLSFD
ncbi:MAG TPA: hypothetical protein VKB23_03625 [Solirubrobacterales bacterium]|nr:hypothetical protein [Solirubrobacterales bacterium]